MLLLAAAQQTGLLEALVKAVIEVADPTIPGLRPFNRAVVEGLVLTLLFLPVAGLARTWDLRSYTGTMLARLCGRERAYSQRYTERFLAKLAHTGAAERLTQVVARWTWSLWQTEQASPDQPSLPTVFYIDGHRKAGLPRIGGVTRCRWASIAGNDASRRLPLDQWLTADAPLL